MSDVLEFVMAGSHDQSGPSLEVVGKSAMHSPIERRRVASHCEKHDSSSSEGTGAGQGAEAVEVADDGSASGISVDTDLDTDASSAGISCGSVGSGSGEEALGDPAPQLEGHWRHIS